MPVNMDEEKDHAVVFKELCVNRKLQYVKWNEALVCGEDCVVAVDLGSCVSVVLAGYDESENVWIGVNHLFRSRHENSDMALEQITVLIDEMKNIRKCVDVRCLGLFGAGYKENSLAKKVANKNVMTILETLSLFNMTIEIFQTGFSQGVSVIYSSQFRKFIIKNTEITTQEKKYYSVSFDKVFGNET